MAILVPVFRVAVPASQPPFKTNTLSTPQDQNCQYKSYLLHLGRSLGRCLGRQNVILKRNTWVSCFLFTFVYKDFPTPQYPCTTVMDLMGNCHFARYARDTRGRLPALHFPESLLLCHPVLRLYFYLLPRRKSLFRQFIARKLHSFSLV